MDSNLGWADHSGHQRSPSRYATFELLTFPSLRLVAKVPFGVRADPVPRIFWGSATHAAHTRTRTHARSVGLLYPGVVAVLNPIPEWIVIFSATDGLPRRLDEHQVRYSESRKADHERQGDQDGDEADCRALVGICVRRGDDLHLTRRVGLSTAALCRTQSSLPTRFRRN